MDSSIIARSSGPIHAPELGPRPDNKVTVEVKLSAGNLIIFADQLAGSAVD